MISIIAIAFVTYLCVRHKKSQATSARTTQNGTALNFTTGQPHLPQSIFDYQPHPPLSTNGIHQPHPPLSTNDIHQPHPPPLSTTAFSLPQLPKPSVVTQPEAI